MRSDRGEKNLACSCDEREKERQEKRFNPTFVFLCMAILCLVFYGKYNCHQWDIWFMQSLIPFNICILRNLMFGISITENVTKLMFENNQEYDEIYSIMRFMHLVSFQEFYRNYLFFSHYPYIFLLKCTSLQRYLSSDFSKVSCPSSDSNSPFESFVYCLQPQLPEDSVQERLLRTLHYWNQTNLWLCAR